MTKAVIFDVDGTLLDTGDWILEAYLYVGESRGTPISRSLMLHELSLGNTLKDTYANLFPGEDFAALREKHREFQDAHMELVRPFARVPETLQKIRDSGIKLITMTNRVRASSIKTMEHSGILKYFDGLCCADDVLRTKPDPEHVFAALRPFVIAPEDSFVVGDSPADIQSGKSAGARTIGVSHGLHADVESLEPDHVIHKIEDILRIVL